MALTDIIARIDAACTANGRTAGSVTLVAVSKLQPLDRLTAVLDQDHRTFGENYVQEAAAKWPPLRETRGPVAVHMVGPLQSNKAGVAVDLFDAIHSIDRASLATRLARIAQERGRCPAIFVQVNTGAEPQKAGIAPAEADAFIAACRAMDLPVAGLMCLPPDGADGTPHFMELAGIAARNGLAGLSMGMSGDFEAAIAQGATHVRIGSAIFGDRMQRA